MPPKPKGDYIETDTGNKVARRSQLYGTQNIILGGRTTIQPEVCIRGDLVRPPPPKDPKDPKAGPQANTSVMVGRYTFVATGSILRPPHRLNKGAMSYHPLKIGDHTFIGEGCIIEAASIGDHVYIGKGTVIGKMVIIKDWVKVLEGSVLAAGTVVPSGSIVGGRPARVVGEVGDGWGMHEGMEGGDMRELWRSVGQV
ncbi:hypothetical protein N7G274_009045 [Stereocaulon virgatum]|uniref:Dynactin subunit 5 n=1 Tax=Stereocaulon virgatum TaxID=373712 RepID=A0ABR3ZXK7_9LECA